MVDQRKTIQTDGGADVPDQNTRAKIIEATAALLSQSCRHAVSIRDIARESGANSALVSYYFGGKEQLYGAVVAEQFAAYEREVVPLFKAEGDIRRNITEACKAIADFHKRRPFWLTLYLRELTNPSACYETVVKPCIENASRQATAMIQAGIDQGVFRPGINARFVVQSLIALVNYQFINQRLLRDLRLDPVDQADSYVEFAIEMVLNHIVAQK
ncbi:MAG: TetR family transcriptional regulator [Geobacter sp.]